MVECVGKVRSYPVEGFVIGILIHAIMIRVLNNCAVCILMK